MPWGIHGYAATRMTPPKGGCMVSAPALDLTTSLRGVFFGGGGGLTQNAHEYSR